MRKLFVMAMVAGMLCGSAFGADYSTDFEGANPLDGWIVQGNASVTSMAHSGSQAILLPGRGIDDFVRSTIYYPLGNMNGTVTMWIYDFGDAQGHDIAGQDASGADVAVGIYGPVWGFANQGKAAGAGLIGKSYVDSDKGYQTISGHYGPTDSNHSPNWFSTLAPTRTSPVSSPCAGTEPEGDACETWVHPVAGWTKWTITVDGVNLVVSAENADGSVSVSDKSYALNVATYGTDGADAIVISGGKDPSSGVIVDDVSFVPEPASLSLLAIGSLLALRRR